MQITTYQHANRTFEVFIDPAGDDHIVIKQDRNGHDRMLGRDDDLFKEVVGRVEPWISHAN